MRIFHRRYSSLTLIAALIFCGACSRIDGQIPIASPQGADRGGPVKSVIIDLPPQSLFAFIGFDVKNAAEVNKRAQETFYTQALPMAAEYGFLRHATMLVTDIGAGDFAPQGFLMSSWPDQAAFDKFQRDPRWLSFDVLRPEIYNEIRYYRDVQENGLKLELKNSKFYTLAIAYFNPDNPGDYHKYLSSLEDEVAANGGKFVLKLKSPALESLSGEPSPDQLTLVEWKDARGVDRVLSSDVYKANRHYAGSGTTKLAFYRLKLAL